LLSLTSGDKKNKRTELDDRKLTLGHAKVNGGQKHNQQNLQIIGGIQPNYLGVYSSHLPQICYHLLQVIEKIKQLNLMTDD